MKNIVLTAALIFSGMAVTAQDYKAPLTATYLAFDTTMNEQPRLEAANKLKLIAKKFPDVWQAQYYAAYSLINLSYSEKDAAKRDALLDEAQGFYEDMLTALGSKENSETHVLAAMMANARMAVKPQQRYQKYGKIFETEMDAAKADNPDNPRIYYLKGVTKYYTPKMFNGGAEAALPYFEKAETLFATETTDDVDVIHWGKGPNAYFLSEIRKEKK